MHNTLGKDESLIWVTCKILIMFSVWDLYATVLHAHVVFHVGSSWYMILLLHYYQCLITGTI